MTFPRAYAAWWVCVGLTTAACDPGLPPMTCAPWAAPEDLAARPSPFDSVVLTAGTNVEAKLCYSRPSARGRIVFGGLVPFDTLWRTGANEPTILHLARSGQVAGFAVAAGDYSIYTVPNPQSWQVVVNASTEQWGLTREERGPAGNLFPNAYTEEVRAQEVGRAVIEVQTVPYTEQLTATVEPVDAGGHRLFIDWETTRLVIPFGLDP